MARRTMPSSTSDRLAVEGASGLDASEGTSITGPWPARSPAAPRVSERMQTYPRRDTSPEVRLRSALHARRLRYRVCMPVPGLARRTIDIAFTRAKIAVFMDGCFWHGCPVHLRPPRTNAAWWEEKVRRNRARDTQTSDHLVVLGWQVLRHWEHEDPDLVAEAIELAVRSKGA